MFESAELGIEIDKKTFAEEAPKVRAALLEAQKRLAASNQAVVVLVSGVEGAGKSETLNLLLEWMDARGIQTHTFGATHESDELWPEYWKYWSVLPPAGRLGIFFGSWYTRPIVGRTFGKMSSSAFDEALDRAVEFERMLASENVLVVKLWLHLSKKAQKKRFKELGKSKKTAWQLGLRDKKYFKRYDEFKANSELAIRRTSTGEAPWHIIEASDPRYRALTVTRTLLQAIEERLAQAQAKKDKADKSKSKPKLPEPKPVNLLSELDYTKSLPDDEYGDKLLELQGRVNQLTYELGSQGRSAIFAFEGADAAGKGGAIRRLTQAMDARLYEVKSVAAPTDEERAHPYLWRFWRALPRKGHVTIYDRSWYGRVLVERIEGFAATEDWQRAYAEINSFEQQLEESGTIVLKFWLAITSEEQLKRFKEREVTPYKQYKITEEDWRNRAKWNAYEAAACDMFEKTSTSTAPWVLVESVDKQWARIKIMKHVVKALEHALGKKQRKK
ncbi:MAG: polyphosphate:AMP phosphotransferase [Deltaproteobacteria bacterium]|nr:polyphosphate:AMP phosphotransferase [Deltaproteobacteria bacterium]